MRPLIDKFLVLVILSVPAIQNAFAIDLQPGDVVAPKPGFSSMQVTYQYAERNDYYLHGEKVAAYPKISSSIYALRLGHSFEVAQLPAYFYAQVPFGAVHPQGGFSTDSGLGDASMAFALWPYANRETKTYFGLAGYLTVPTGSYDSKQVFNMGENRYRTALQLGYDTPLADKLAFMAAFDAVWYGDNNNASIPKQHQKLEQDALYTGQVGLRYDFNPQYSLTGTYYYTFGGETSYDGIESNNPTRLQRYQVSGVANYSFGRITVHYGGDIKTENGYYEDQRLTLRYTVRF